MQAKDLRRRYIDFFVKKHHHKEIGGASLIPENDPTVLFTTAGMHPLVPYFMGQKHPEGTRLVDCQKCLRTDDIDEVGDLTHLTFFEMLGNWSLGDYFKEGAIKMSYEFLTSKIKDGGLEIDPNKLHVSCFAGDSDASKDDDAASVWESLGFQRVGEKFDPDKDKRKIFFFAKKENWWGPAGQVGPCGPDTEIFFDTEKPACKNCAKKGPSCDCGRFVEIWNDVFMEFNKKDDGSYEPLKKKNVDTGLGLERVTAVLQGKKSHYDTELFLPIIEKIQTLCGKNPESDEELKSARIIADHLRAATFVLGDPIGVVPSNTDQGYVVRRLIRRAIRHGRHLGIQEMFTTKIAEIIIANYSDVYEELSKNKNHILKELEAEEHQFEKTLKSGEKEFEKIRIELENRKEKVIDGLSTFKLYDTYGFPLEMTKDLAKEYNLKIDEQGFEQAFKKHQELSRVGAKEKFAGGLIDHSEDTVRLHTATHLLHQALRTILGHHVQQKGSNITKDRLRFDFSHPDKVTEEQVAQVEDLVNKKIQEDLPVNFTEMTVEEAKNMGALGFFEHKYGEKVKVYTVGDPEKNTVFSREICGGPHVNHTLEVGRFKITKEEAISAGIRRIKAVVEKSA